MAAVSLSDIPVLIAVLAAAAGSTGLGLLEPGLPLWAAGGLTALWSAAAYVRLGKRSALGLLPAIALLPGGGWVALVGWSLAALTAGLVIGQGRLADADQVRRLRAELRDAEHERTLLRRHIQRYPALLEACLELSVARELDHFAFVLCQRARELLPEVREVLVFLGSGDRQECRASCDDRGVPCPRAAGQDERYVAAEARPLTRRESGAIRLLIPLRGDRRRAKIGEQDEVLRGALVVTLATNEVGDRLALELFGALGRLGGLGLAAVDLVNQARGLAMRDDLTGLYGQHEFLRRLAEQVAAGRRSGMPLGVIMCDMDQLKRYNDTYGHPAGDAALRGVALAMTRTLPADAIACRYGGEEFAATVPVRDLAGLLRVAEALRAAIAAALPEGPAAVAAPVTASLGIAVLTGDESARALLARADAACYQAKARGRNRVEVAS